MEILSRKFTFDLLGLLKVILIMISLGAMMTLYRQDIAWITIMGSVFLAIYELTNGYYKYQKKREEKEIMSEHPPKEKRKKK